jgi:hypothetical protein
MYRMDIVELQPSIRDKSSEIGLGLSAVSPFKIFSPTQTNFRVITF